MAPLLEAVTPGIGQIPTGETTEQASARIASEVDVSEQDRLPTRFSVEQVLSGAGGPTERFAPHWFASGVTGRVLDGGDWVIHDGYSALVDALADGLDIRLGSPVRSIGRSPSGVEVSTGSETFEASHVIVTVPLGVLKAGEIEFSPELPADRQDALSRLEMGHFEKVVMTFDERFWETELPTFNDNTAYYVAGVGKDKAFPQFFDVTTFARRPMVVCLYDSSFALAAVRSMSDAELIDGTRSALAAIVGMEVPLHRDAAVTRWDSDPWSRGSYSYFPIGSTPADMALIGEPIDGRLLFAGEHTTPEYNATTHGAMLSGLREAQRIAPEAGLPGWRS